MSINDHAQDRYDPPSVGSEWEEHFFSELNRGDVFRVLQSPTAKQYRDKVRTTRKGVCQVVVLRNLSEYLERNYL